MFVKMVEGVGKIWRDRTGLCAVVYLMDQLLSRSVTFLAVIILIHTAGHLFAGPINLNPHLDAEYLIAPDSLPAGRDGGKSCGELCPPLPLT